MKLVEFGIYQNDWWVVELMIEIIIGFLNIQLKKFLIWVDVAISDYMNEKIIFQFCISSRNVYVNKYVILNKKLW